MTFEPSYLYYLIIGIILVGFLGASIFFSLTKFYLRTKNIHELLVTIFLCFYVVWAIMFIFIPILDKNIVKTIAIIAISMREG